jgi:hypothetical protein
MLQGIYDGLMPSEQERYLSKILELYVDTSLFPVVPRFSMDTDVNVQQSPEINMHAKGNILKFLQQANKVMRTFNSICTIYPLFIKFVSATMFEQVIETSAIISNYFSQINDIQNLQCIRIKFRLRERFYQ